MRYLTIIIAFLLIPNIFFAQQTYVPDDNFEQELIRHGYDKGALNDSVPTANIDTVTYLWISGYFIYDLTGIEDFTALVRLECDDNRLTRIDVSNNFALQELYCHENNLTSLDVSKNTALQVLNCWHNELTSLDISKNTALQELYCYLNKLRSLDVSKNTALVDLNCWGNQLTSLVVSNNTALKNLYCDRNNLTSLDLSNNTALSSLNCAHNSLINLDLSNNTALKVLACYKNNLASLNIRNGNNINMIGNIWTYYFIATGNPDLYCIQVDDSSWSANAEKWVKDSHAHYSEDCGYTSVGEFLSAGTAINIFPNPADKNFTVSFELETPKTITMTLTDLSGRELQEFSFEHRQFVNEEIDVSQLSSGVYFLRIDFGGGSISKKIVVE